MFQALLDRHGMLRARRSAGRTEVPPPGTVAANFDRLGIPGGKPVVTTCGSGVAACTISLGLYLLGQADAPVYDGSWSEWGARADTEKRKAWVTSAYFTAVPLPPCGREIAFAYLCTNAVRPSTSSG